MPLGAAPAHLLQDTLPSVPGTITALNTGGVMSRVRKVVLLTATCCRLKGGASCAMAHSE